MDLALTGKVAMITGGSHGLGKQAADSLAREGCKVAICARGQENLDSTVAEFEAKGYEILAVHGARRISIQRSPSSRPRGTKSWPCRPMS